MGQTTWKGYFPGVPWPMSNQGAINQAAGSVHAKSISEWFSFQALSLQTVYHGQGILVVEQSVDVVDNLSGVVVRNLTRPACPNAFCTVHQQHWNDGNVPLWLHLLVVIIQELEQVEVHGWE